MITYRMTHCLDHLEMSGNLIVVRECQEIKQKSGKCQGIIKEKYCQGKPLVVNFFFGATPV